MKFDLAEDDLRKTLLFLLFFIFLSVPQTVVAQENSVFELYIQKQIEIEDGRGILRAIVYDDLKFIREQLINGLNPDMSIGKIPVIFFPIYLNKPQSLALFLEFGANPDKTFAGESPLNFAVYRNSKDSLLELIKNGANLNSKNLGKTPLDWALKEKNYLMAEILIKNGADISSKNNKKIRKIKNAELLKLIEE
jgi:ankyrin repeat protein